MAKFTFGAGNARKAFGLPLYALGALITIFVPRSADRWVFGCGIGLAEGALPLHRLARERLTGSKITWLARSSAELDEAKTFGFDAVMKDGLRGFWHTARAQVIVVTHGFGDVNRYAIRGGFVVQLWHGIPFKHLHLDSPATFRLSILPNIAPVRWLLTKAYQRAGRNISMFPVASARVAPYITSGFGVPIDRIAITGDVRDDVLLAGDESARTHNARLRLEAAVGPLPTSSRLILFAPTWRDGYADPGVPDQAEWQHIVEFLDSTNATLFIRTHPLGHGDYSAGPQLSDRVVLLGPDLIREVNPVLPAFDALVTDYSSIAFDFALTGRPTVYFAADVAAYLKSRGFYFPYAEISGRHAESTWSDTLAALDQALQETSDGPLHQHAAQLRHEFFDFADGRAAERVLNEILIRTGRQAICDATGQATNRPTVTAIEATGTTLELIVTSEQPVTAARFVGERSTIKASVESQGTRLNVSAELLVPRWGQEPLAWPSGHYLLELTGAQETSRIAIDCPTKTVRHQLFHAEVGAKNGFLAVEIQPPLADDERGSAAQRALERRYRQQPVEVENAVYFESFFGRSASCNPWGIDHALALSHPNIRRYWSVIDGSIPIPDGAIRLIEGSAEWWRIRGAARLLIVNDWLRKRYRRRPHQKVLQTWHGSTFKRLALDRPHHGLHAGIAARLESRRWDALIAQNDFSADHLRTAYAFSGPIWVEGYPRNDIFQHPGHTKTVRERLGITPATRIVLYAPTWRDDRQEIVKHLDLAELAATLGDDHILLVRGHSRTLAHGSDVTGRGLLDVSTYPNMADLLMVADVFVTDYSSSMFDWSTTGRPIVFFVPDLDHYRDNLRGFYADLLSDAPGPIVRSPDDLSDAIRNADTRAGQFATAAARWRAEFAAHDDGYAGARVVTRLEAEGWLD